MFLELLLCPELLPYAWSWIWRILDEAALVFPKYEAIASYVSLSGPPIMICQYITGNPILTIWKSPKIKVNTKYDIDMRLVVERKGIFKICLYWWLIGVTLRWDQKDFLIPDMKFMVAGMSAFGVKLKNIRQLVEMLPILLLERNATLEEAQGTLRAPQAEHSAEIV